MSFRGCFFLIFLTSREFVNKKKQSRQTSLRKPKQGHWLFFESSSILISERAAIEHALQSGRNEVRQITTDDVKNLKSRLFALQHFGAKLKELFNRTVQGYATNQQASVQRFEKPTFASAASGKSKRSVFTPPPLLQPYRLGALQFITLFLENLILILLWTNSGMCLAKLDNPCGSFELLLFHFYTFIFI